MPPSKVPAMDKAGAGAARDPWHSREEVKGLASFHVGVSKNRGTPKWMVYNGRPY